MESKFEQNILDSSNSWELNFKTEKPLKGMPNNAIETAAEIAKVVKKNKADTLLHAGPALLYGGDDFRGRSKSKKEDLHILCKQSIKRVSYKGKWDNTKIIEEILELRQLISEILGFQNYAEYSLATKMAKTPGDVVKFLNDLKKKAIRKSRNEFSVLKKYAKDKLKMNKFEPWDLAYVAEKYKEDNFLAFLKKS